MKPRFSVLFARVWAQHPHWTASQVARELASRRRPKAPPPDRRDVVRRMEQQKLF